ncbi:MAG TPA: pullulanase-type alpha-1,6-glucosidase [Dermatophilaceae bacterium]|nr:pullulanase-type alpha-1,6-glucosidase [Dermatophilaceae bacterium]
MFTTVVLALVGMAPVVLAGPAAAADRTATLAGSLQSEVGCAADWDPACPQSALEKVGDTTYRSTFTLPAGSYEFKIAIDGDWAENYGAGGARDGANIPLVLGGPAAITFTYDDATHQVAMTTSDIAGDSIAADARLAGRSLRKDLTRERFYFVMPDRFANGSAANDLGGLTGDRLVTGFDPTDRGFYHGGDLRGLTNRLDYIKGLGTTAIWLTPSFKNKPVQGSGDNVSAGYHGYWVTDFTRIDPHLGTNAQMRELIGKAHRLGMKVFFDIITNHTADVIRYADGTYDYTSKADRPYTDASGTPFDDKDYAGTNNFPALDKDTSFPERPVFGSAADASVKAPAWLNNPIYYHNRGDSTFSGESTEYGDFFGLDDLFTEQPAVADGMTKIYQTWAGFGLDGFRIDTVKHVNIEFWQQFSPRLLAAARAAGKPRFFMFGEVFDGSPAFMSRYTTEGKLPATLDFGFQGNALGFAQGKATTSLRDFYAADDYYTDADSNAYSLPTFLGNHDIGRFAKMLRDGGADQLLERTELANRLMYLTRGQPITYYGDEQGFMGAPGGNTDQAARQDMFATQVQQYADEENLFGPGAAGSKYRFGTHTPLYRLIAQMAALRAAHPALADGAQIHRYASNEAGVYAFSRVDAGRQVEYLVVANNAAQSKQATFATFSPRTRFAPLLGAARAVTTDGSARVTVSVPPLSVKVFRAIKAIPPRASAPTTYLTVPTAGATVGGRTEIRAALPVNDLAQVTFAVRPVGTTAWQVLGTDDNAPYRVFHDVSRLAAGTLLEYRAVTRDHSGNISARSTYAIVGVPAGTSTGTVGPVVQPANVSVPGSHNSEMGCSAGDWQPACDQAQLALDADDQIWKGTFAIPPGDYEYKAAINKAWDENYGLGAVRDGPNIPYTAPGGDVTFYYDHATHWVTSSTQGPVITAPGSYQSELGCPADWLPDCMRPWLQDPDGDGTYTWSSDQIPAGTYEFKVAHGLSWDENYGAGGAPNGANVALSVPSDGTVVTISYVLSSHVMTARTSIGGANPDLTKAKAVFVNDRLIAWPATAVPSGTPVQLLDWRLHWARSGGLAVDAEDVTGGPSAVLTRDPAGLPASVVQRHPELAGYVALRLDRATAQRVGGILKGQVAVGMYDDLGRLMDATGVQIAPVLDSLYAASAGTRGYGVSWSGSRPSFRVWAPTAQGVRTLVWPAGSSPTAPASEATAVVMTRAGDGSWTGTGKAGWKGVRYLFEVVVYAPSTGKVETNLVTDPYSVALTLDSTRSVAVSLRDRRFMPALWRTARAPALGRTVDQTIYELHVRDFSITDTSVPAEHRGSYLAFADDGFGAKHLRALAAAGLNTVHLLPTFDIASIPEDRTKQETPHCDLPSLPPDSEEQQACVTAVAANDAYNWGYDPFHWMVPEGSYASSNAAADGGSRVAEFRTMVGGLHANGLRVVLDQVFNHTPTSGQAGTSVLDKVVPGYYYRLDANGAVTTSTCCQNVATEHAMGQKIMVDGVLTWAREYKVDGFRFDLMGHHSRANMLAVRHALNGLTLAADGVDGSKVTLYGEGWNFGEVANNARFVQATQGQLGGTHIGTFSDRLRDAVRGGGPFDENPRIQGFGSGEYTDSNGDPVNGDAATQQARLAHDTDLVQLGLAGNLRSFTFRSAQTGAVVRGDAVSYNGAPAGYADQPDEIISYVDAHDNETLFDNLALKLPQDTAMADRVRMNTLSLATVALAQTPAFWHAGADLLRSKSLDRNSYDSGDWFNRLDWTGADNGFGHGLPKAADNSSKWPFMRPLLADPALKPSAADVQAATAAAQDLLRLRFSTPLFRLGTAAAVNAKVSFPVSGTPDAHPGVVVMRIDDTVGGNADPALKGLVVVFNATPSPVTQELPGLAGANLALSPVQAAGSDPVVKSTFWDPAAGTLTVPGRTVAVFTQS